jgi:release factor glutamine methyltransferase
VRVAPGVYVPRYQSEDLAHRAATLLARSRGRTAVDLCTGTGAIAAHLRAAVPTAAVAGLDVDERAVACARSNGVPAVRGDLDHPPFRAGAVDVVTAVAPYVPTAEMAFLPADVQRYEPRRALDGGDDGLDLVRRVVASAGRLLRPGGRLLVEIGADQDEQLAAPLAAAGFGPPTPWYDEDGDLRGLTAERT